MPWPNPLKIPHMNYLLYIEGTTWGVRAMRNKIYADLVIFCFILCSISVQRAGISIESYENQIYLKIIV